MSVANYTLIIQELDRTLFRDLQHRVSDALILLLLLIYLSSYRFQMEELEGDTVDLHVHHQPNLVEQLKSELYCKKMLFPKNSLSISNVVGQGKQPHI